MQTHKQTEVDRENRTAYLANGVIGLRIPQIPLQRQTAYLQGYAGATPAFGIEGIQPIPYPLGADVAINGWWLSEYPRFADFIEQEYDFSCGELTSRFRFSADGVTAVLEVLTFCSRTQPMVAVQQTRVAVNKPCKLIVQANMKWDNVPGRLLERIMPGRSDQPQNANVRDAIVNWESSGALTTAGIAYDSWGEEKETVRRQRNDYGHERDCALTNYVIQAEPEVPYVMDQIAAAVPGVMHEQPHWQAARMVDQAAWYGVNKLRKDNRDAWQELWRGRPLLHGAPSNWQAISDAGYFYLHSSIHPSSLTGIAPFGLSDTNYHGHVFWDYESFMFPGVVLTSPEAAKASMEYRGRCLNMARNNARMYGRKGAQFPWQSGNTGSEVTTYYSSAREFHINPAVAYAVGQYMHATGDELFLREHGWPILKNVAEWICDFVTETERGYETRHVASPNETYHDVHNDSQLHLFIKAALRQAVFFGTRLGLDVPAQWQHVADHLFMPVDPEAGVLVQFENFPLKTDKRASVGPMWHLFPLDISCGKDIDKATRAYYCRSMSSYYGMPMSSAYCSVWAARCGLRQEAVTALDKGIAARIAEPYMQMAEAAADREEGPHGGDAKEPWLTRTTDFVTGQGSFITACLLGFTGLELTGGSPETTWCKHAPALPEGWKAIEVERIWAHGRPARLIAEQGKPNAELIR
ncbi:MAG: hypothetical protein ACOCWJ_02665 [Verrucomicrobiota bacterium]